MTTTSVGMRCPDCSRKRTRVRTLPSTVNRPVATYTLIAINVLVFVVSTSAGGGITRAGGGEIMHRGELFGPAVAVGHEYWRLLTSGFLHAGILHLGLNMLFLFFLGSMLEPAIGRARFLTVYFVSLLGGSLGALLLSPDAPTVGASGACFGLLGGAIALALERNIPIWESGLGATLVINLIFTFSISNISIGGHLGGVAAGFVAGFVLIRLGERRGRDAIAFATCALLAVAIVAGAVAVAGGNSSLT
jgi:membrane associated rhomboid family serine protease